jgi:SMI1-KNR4 cell-wall
MTFDIGSFTTPDGELPSAPVAIDWSAVEGWLGLRLPDDYKDLASRCGPVLFGNWIWIYVPCSRQNGADGYSARLADAHRDARVKLRELPEEERLAVYPEPGGLLAWGDTRGTDILFWDTSVSEDPNEWTVVVHHADGIPQSGLPRLHPFDRGLLRWQRYDLSVAEYLRLTVREERDLPSPPGPMIGPLPRAVARTAWLENPGPWTPPAPLPSRLTAVELRSVMETGVGLDALRLLAPPLENPYLGDGTWEGLFEELGIALPREYVTLMDEYGAGEWAAGSLRFYVPLRTGEKSYLRKVQEITGWYRNFRDEWPENYPLAVWPESGGFLPFADNRDGDQVGWLTQGDDPDQWPLIVWPRHFDQGPPLEHGLIDMLLELLRDIVRNGGFGTPEEALSWVQFDSCGDARDFDGPAE